MGRFDGKSVIVTGGAMGIGRCIALAFAADGALVTIADTAVPPSVEVIREISQSGLGQAQAIRTDVARSTDALAAVDKAVATYGRLDILINNAGIQPPESNVTVAELDEGTWDRVIDVNLKGPYLMSKYAIPHLQRAGAGVIVNVASVQGLQSQRRLPAYAASKGGLLSLTRNMALDFAPTVRVVAICPGAIETRPVLTGMPASADERNPMRRMGRPEDVADAVLFVASSAGSFITGEHLIVDGGYMAIGAWPPPGSDGS